MRSLKIAMFGQKHIPSSSGGVERVAEELSTRMAKLGHRVTCYHRGGPKRAEYQGVSLRGVWTLEKKGLAAVTSSFFAALHSGFSDADVVHIHAEGPAWMCWIPKLLGKRVVVTVHGLDWQREKWKGSFGAAYIRAGERMAVRFADEIIVLSRNMQAYFRYTYRRETVWIPNGVSPLTPTAPEQITERFGLRQEDYILYLGRLVPEKGIHYLIEAFQKVITQKKLVIAGAASDSDAYVRRLREMAAGEDRILFTGLVQGKIREELYTNAYLYVLPSDLEGMPLSLLEAMSYGKCCLISDIPECTEAAGSHAVRFSKGNVDSLRGALQRLCDTPELVRSYGQGARAYVFERYNWDDVVKRTLELYDENSDDQ